MSPRGSALVATVVACLPLIALATPSAADSPPAATLTIVSTPDDPFAGGRYVIAPLNSMVNGPDALVLGFHRRDADDLNLVDDPTWVVRVPTPADVSLATPYPLTGSPDDALQLADNWTWQRTYCPDLSGSVTFEDVATDVDGAATALAATFIVHCTPDDTLYGSLGFGTTAPPLASDADALVVAEARFPSLISVFDGTYAETLAIDVRRRGLLLRWDSPSGFVCAHTQIDDESSSTPVSYTGRDDTLEVGGLDPTSRYGVHLWLSDTEPCGDTALATREADVVPVVTTLRRPEVDRSRGTVLLRGRVDIVVPGYSEPARFVDVVCKARKPDGSVVVRDGVAADVNGHFELTLPRRHAQHMWIVVRPDEEPTPPEAVHDYWYHFGDASNHYAIP